MKIEGVTFVENAVKSMTKEEFIERHIKVLWQDRKEASRKKMLSDIRSDCGEGSYERRLTTRPDVIVRPYL